MLACLLFTLHRIWTANYEVLSWKSLRRVELKSVAVLLLIISMTVMVAYDLTAAVIKYREGFWVDQVTAIIITRPREKYTPENRVLFPAISVMLNLSWTIQCTALFLMTALWNHMSKAMFNKPFMTSFEFKVYSVYSVFIFAVYPFLQIM